MFCPQCGTESQAGVQYCRICGSNLKVIGKAVSLSEAIARSDRGPLPKIKEMVRNLKVDQVTEEVSHALDNMNQEIAKISPESKEERAWISFGKKKTPAEKREDHISKGVVSLFSGVGLGVFLYFLSASLVLRLPPEIIAQVPFEIEPVVKMIWLLGLLPATSGIGHIIAGLLIRPRQEQELVSTLRETPALNTAPGSVTERTTNLLERERISRVIDPQKRHRDSA